MRLTALPAMAALVVAGLAGCTDVPPFPAAGPETRRDTSYPALIPARQITGRVPPPSADTAAAQDTGLRAARLRDRAARLESAVIDDATRDRMRTGITR